MQQPKEINDSAVAPTNGALPPLSAAERVARSRERRKAGFIGLWIEIHNSDISGLVRDGLLARDRGSDKDKAAIKAALYAHFERTLGPIPSAIVSEPREFKEHFG